MRDQMYICSRGGDRMAEVGVKNLRNDLCAWLDRTEAGEELIVLHRGQEVVRIVLPRRERAKFLYPTGSGSRSRSEGKGRLRCC